MENSMVRQRYTRRPSTVRRHRRAPRANGVSLRQIIARQLIICVLLLIMIGIVKSINISATNFIADKVKYVLSHNVELKNVFSYVENLAADIRKSITPAFVGKPALTEISTSSTTPASSTTPTSSTTPASSTTPTSIAAPAITSISEADTTAALESNTATLSSIAPAKDDAPGLTDNTNDVDSFAEDATISPETSVLSASIEDVSLYRSDMLVPIDGTLGSLHGEKTDAVTGTVKIHKGIDINVKKGGSIKAVLDGKVTDTGSSPTYGSYIRIKHADGLQTVYANCSSLIATKGVIVKRGDLIAAIGDTGVSVGSHLHFEVWKDGNAVDPLEYISVPAR